jgi:polyferredoxin
LVQIVWDKNKLIIHRQNEAKWWNKFMYTKKYITFPFLTIALLFTTYPLQNPIPGVPVVEEGNICRQLTGKMVHPSQVSGIMPRASWH